MYGLVWRIDVISRRFPAGDQNRTEMSDALDHAEKALGAGRERMFAPQQTEEDGELILAERLNVLGRTWAMNTGIAFQFDVRHQRPLRREIVCLLERILSEALVNAFRHASASQVRVTLHFDDDELRCVVSDDGAGIPPKVLETPPAGHLGLRLMRDRAATIGATLTIRRVPSGGSKVVLVLPSGKAYERAGFWRRSAEAWSSFRSGFRDLFYTKSPQCTND